VALVRPAGDGALQLRMLQIVASNRPSCLYAGSQWSDAPPIESPPSACVKRLLQFLLARLDAVEEPVRHRTDYDSPAPSEDLQRSGVILIVEDDPQVRDAMEMLLRDEGHHPVTASDGIAALEWLAQETQEGFGTRYASGGLDAVDLVQHWIPEIILLDINMRGYDVFQTARILRRLVTTGETVIIAYTAHAEGDIRDRGVSAGFDAYCRKGVSSEALIWIVRALMR
jgi:CheY-like chemotaxis protein